MPAQASNTHLQLDETVDSYADELWALSLDIHSHPETAYQEHRTTRLLQEWLTSAGLRVEAPLGGIETAFKASLTLGSGGPVIGLLAEYDALPEIGHACGHNLICAAAVGAARALATVGPAGPGEIRVIGTPAEEGGGGKLRLLAAGAFDDVDFAMMFHGGARTMTRRGSLALTRVTMKFHGKASHAASWPHLGINALDACIQTFNVVNSLRQHVPDETRIHGVIRHGGTAPNIVPEYAEAEFLVRHPSSETAALVMRRVKQAAESSAAAVGATVVLEDGLEYPARRNSEALAALFGTHLEQLGEKVKEPPSIGGVGSSDFNAVSQTMPAVHPYIQMVPEGISAHTHEFREGAASEAGRRAMLLAAKSLARSAADLLLDPALRSAARLEFQEANSLQGIPMPEGGK